MQNISRKQLFGRGKQAAVRPAARTLIRGADVLTMDSRLGELPSTDVLIENGRITQIGRGLQAGGAQVVEAQRMILMPGMIDGHRHTWETPLIGELVKTEPRRYSSYIQYNNQKVGVCFRPEDVYLGNLLGGLSMIDTGITAVVDQAHVIHTPEKGDAAARGLKDSGIGGIFCYQLTHTPSYGPGSTVSAAQAAREFWAPADEWHIAEAARVRDQYFSDGAGPLYFGVGLSGTQVGPERTIESCIWEFERARALRPKLMTQHSMSIRHLQPVGLLGPDLHVSHGNGLTLEELRMMADAGVKLCSTTMGEYAYDDPQIHGRARAAGVDVGIGMDVPVALHTDNFEHVRNAFWSFYRSEDGMRLADEYTSEEVLAFATSLGAKAIGLGDVTGSISVGKQADLVLLRTDRIGFAPAGSLADRVLNFATQPDIDSVWVAGVLRKTGGRVIGVDWRDFKQQVRALQEYVFAQAETMTFV